VRKSEKYKCDKGEEQIKGGSVFILRRASNLIKRIALSRKYQKGKNTKLIMIREEGETHPVKSARK